MQFNTSYLSDLSRYGITENDVAAAGCYSFDLAAWRLRMHIRNDKGDIWTKAANYHSRTPKYNTLYRTDLMLKALKWANWLESNFVTMDLTKTEAAASRPTKSISQDIIQQTVVEPTKPTSTVKPVVAQPAIHTGYLPRQITFHY